MDCLGRPTGLQSRGLGSFGDGDRSPDQECVYILGGFTACDSQCKSVGRPCGPPINTFRARYCVEPPSIFR